MERKIGSTQLRRRLTDVLQSVREERATYLIETFDRVQAALISLDEYRQFQRYKLEHGALSDEVEDQTVQGAPASLDAREEQARDHLDRALSELAALEAVSDESLDLSDVVVRLEQLAQQYRQNLIPQGAFGRILERAVDLGVSDLAEQHDHYLTGAEKR